MNFKGFLTKTLLFISLLSVSGTATYFICYSQKDKNSYSQTQDKPITELTPQEKLINSLTNIQKFDLDAEINMEYQKTMTEGHLTFTGSGDFSDFSNIKLSGNLSANMGLTSFSADLGYYDSNIYLDFNESYLYLTTDDILDFIDMLPSMGLNIALPDELKNFDVDAFEEDILSAEPIKDVVGYYFTINLNETIQLIFTSDDNYNFTGLRTNKFYYKDLFFQLNANLKTVEETAITLVNPSTVENAPTYVNFAPAFNLINGMYNLFTTPTNTVNLDLSLNKYDENLLNNNLVDLNLDISYDINTTNISVAGNIVENENTHKILLSLLDSTLYANYNDAIKVSLETENVANLIEFLLDKIGSEEITNILNSLSETTNDLDIVELITNFTNLNNLIKAINVTENCLEITIDLSIFNIEAEEFVLLFNFEKTEFLGLKLNNFNISGYNGSLALTVKSYNPAVINVEEYSKLEYPLSTMQHVFNLINQTKFRLELEGSVKNINSEILPVTINGGLQFDLTDNVENGYGYGELTIVDRSNYTHDLYVDLKDKNLVLFKYNEDLKGKFKTQSVLDLVDLVEQIINEKDEHFMELFGDLINSLGDSGISQIISTGNYGKLLASNIIKDFKTDATKLSIDIDASIIGLEDVFTLVVNYSFDDELEYSLIDSLEIKGLNFNEEEINFKISLRDFDESLETTRLIASAEYLDFSDIKLLLAFGINTSKVNDWHLTTQINLALGSISLDKLSKFTVDIKIKNLKGKIKAAVEINDLPYVPGVNGNPTYYSPSNRKVSFYYYNDLIYGYRSENCKTSFLFGKSGLYESYFTSTLDNFLDNAIDYICRFGLSLSDSIMNQINDSGNSGSTSNEPIHYENILTKFSYNSEGEVIGGKSYPYFNICINLAEITKDEVLDSIKLKLYCDTENERFHGFNASLIIDFGLQMSISATAILTNFGEVLDLDYIDEYAAKHAGDELNKTYEVFTRL